MENLTLQERILLEGKPFQLKVSTTDNLTTVAEFTLDDDDADIDGDNTDETTPFKNKMLFVTGIKIINDAGNVLDFLAFDEEVVIDGGLEGFSADDDFFADGRVKASGATDLNNPTVKDLMGVWALIVKYKVAIKASASTGNNTDLYLYGLYVDRQY